MNGKYFDTLFHSLSITGRIPKTFAILTAYNPMDQMYCKTENDRRNQELLHILQGSWSDIATVTGCSPDLSHQEPGFLLQCSQEDALVLAKTFDQRAFFWVTDDRLEMIECASGASYSAGSFRARIR